MCARMQEAAWTSCNYFMIGYIEDRQRRGEREITARFKPAASSMEETMARRAEMAREETDRRRGGDVGTETKCARCIILGEFV